MNTPQVDWAEPIKTDDRDEYIRELEAKLAEKENPTTGNPVADEYLQADPQIKIVEVGGVGYTLRRVPHSQWLPYFSKIIGFSSENGETVGEVKDISAATDFVFTKMLVRPKVNVDDIADFTDVLLLTTEGISHQMTSGN